MLFPFYSLSLKIVSCALLLSFFGAIGTVDAVEKIKNERDAEQNRVMKVIDIGEVCGFVHDLDTVQKPLQEGMILKEGMKISTPDGCYLPLSLPSGVRFLVGPHAQLMLDSIDSPGGAIGHAVTLSYGSVWVIREGEEAIDQEEEERVNLFSLEPTSIHPSGFLTYGDLSSLPILFHTPTQSVTVHSSIQTKGEALTGISVDPVTSQVRRLVGYPEEIFLSLDQSD